MALYVNTWWTPTFEITPTTPFPNSIDDENIV